MHDIEIVKDVIQDTFVIFSDSRLTPSIVECSKHPPNRAETTTWRRDTEEWKKKSIELCWSPGHAGIVEIEKAVVRASWKPQKFIFIHYKDFYPSIQNAVDRERNEQFVRTDRKKCLI